jgi:hypothetical protein
MIHQCVQSTGIVRHPALLTPVGDFGEGARAHLPVDPQPLQDAEDVFEELGAYARGIQVVDA